MRLISYLFLFVMIAATTMPAMWADNATPSKRALLIGVHKYDHGRPHDPSDLNTSADVETLKAVLIKKFGFPENNITVLESENDTTKESIKKAFEQLTRDTGAGDLVYFHFSGHGTEVPDPTKHKLSWKDQTIVPSNFDFDKTDDYCHTIIDREIKVLAKDLLAKHPTLLTMTFDSCHSGSITRSTLKVRGFDFPGNMPVPPAGSQATGGDDKLVDLSDANLVVISACRADQRAFETQVSGQGGMGLFTYALAKAYENADDKTTYRDLFGQIVSNMAAKESVQQTPALDGKVDNVLMSGTAIHSEPAIDVTRDHDGNMVLKAGEIQGMTVGSKFDLFPGDAKDLKKTAACAKAKVKSVSLVKAFLEFDGPPSDPKAKDFLTFKAKETSHSYGDKVLKLSILGLDAKQSGELTKGLQECPAVSAHVGSKGDFAGTDWDICLQNGADPSTLVLMRKDGHEISSYSSTKGISDDMLSDIKGQIEGEYRWRYVKELANKSPDSGLEVDLRIVPVKITKKDANDVPLEVVPITDSAADKSAGVLKMADKTNFVVEVRNRGRKPAFINILDLTNDGSISPLYPLAEVGLQQNNEISPDKEWHRIPLPYVYQVKPPFGTEIIKVIATSTPADFSPLVRDSTTRSADGLSRGSDNPVANLLIMANSGRRATLSFAPSDTWDTNSATIETVGGKGSVH